MTLLELLEHAAEWTDDDTTICVAQPWRCGSDAILVSPAPESAENIEQNGTSYAYSSKPSSLASFWKITRHQRTGPGRRQQRCERLIGYAVNDA